MALIDRPVIAPDRIMSGFNPRTVLHHFSKLLEDKEDTEQVFHIVEATKGRATHKQAANFVRSARGQRFLKAQVNIPEMLDAHERWQGLCANSVAQHYIRFMKREGLSAQGLVDESHKWAPEHSRPADQLEWYFNRLRDTHDLFHVLTGYGRDALGEACLLGFSYSQNYNKGVLFIAYAGGYQIKKMTGTKAPILSAIREGQRLGKAAAKIAHEDVEALMHEDIDAARARLKIGKPTTYQTCLQILQSEGHEEETPAHSAAPTLS